MLKIIVGLALITGIFWVGFHISGALLTAAIWLFIKLPIAVLLGCLGLALCITILLIPLGIKCVKLAGSMLS